jgi:4-amino-4-deoxy-L-arabinose transferase-like glycosyltransferase
MSPPLELSHRSLALLALAALVLWFANLDYRKLIKPDEGRYAEISREMMVSGDWVTPRLNGIKYFEKPPLHYWAGAAAMSMFGTREWAARLWSALTGLLGIVVAWYTGRRLIGPRAGMLAASILGSTLMYVVVGHLNTLDMGLTLFLFVALCGFLLAQRDDASPRENAIWMHAAWAAMAAALLSKGLIGVVIPGATLVLYTLIQRDWRLWRCLHLITGTLLFLAIAAPWFVLVSARNPGFALFFFVHEHFLRYTTQIHQRGEPWHYFIPLLIAGSLPWTVVMSHALWRGWKTEPERAFQPRRFLVLWSVFVFLFFSASGSKLPPYILPLFPALALLTAVHVTTLPGRTLGWQLLPVMVLALGVLIGLFFVRSSGDTPAELIQSFKPWLAAGALASMAAVAWGTRLAWSRRVDTAVLTAGLGALLAVQLMLTGHESVSPSMSAFRLAQAVKPYLKPDAPFYSVAMYDQTLDFYLGRTVTLVEFRDELDFGLQQEPQLAIPTVGDWIELWRAQPYAFAIMEKINYDRFAAAGLPMELITHDQRRYVVKTR